MSAFLGNVDLLLHARDAAACAGEALGLPVLVLNRIFQPVRITTARRAMTLLYTGNAQALDGEGELFDWGRWVAQPVRTGVDDGLRVVNGELRVPRIVHLRCYARLRNPAVRLTRRNLMLRDGFVCQYCSQRGHVSELDIDHVLPRSRGGEDSWTNLVTACQPCNRHKGRRTPQEAGMSLLRHPDAPRWSHVVQLLVGSPRRYQEWEPFLKAG